MAYDKPELRYIWAEGGDAVEPSGAKKQLGWVAEVPPHQYENWVQRRQDQFIFHVNERGIPEWDGQTNYLGDGRSIVQGSNGVVYKSVAASGPSSVVQDPATDAANTYWEKAYPDNDDPRVVNAVPNSRQVNTGDGLSGGGNLTTNRTLSVDSSVVRTSRNLSDLSSAPAARQNLGLGTAATRDVGESSGNVMEVGAFGLGKSYSPPIGFDFNTDFDFSGFISPTLGENVVNSPYQSWGGLISCKNESNEQAGQLYLSNTNLSSATDPRLHIRTKPSGGVWTPWKEVLSTGNILANTGQSTEYPMTQKAVTDAINNSVIGVGQTWQNVISEREFGTTYTNTTGRAIFVSIVAEEVGGSAPYLTVDGIVVGSVNTPSTSIAIQAQLTAIVPPSSEYSLARGGTTQEIMDWTELR